MTKIPSTFTTGGLYLSLLLVSFFSAGAWSQEARELGKPYAEFGEYKVFFSVFNSSFIPPKIAEIYNLRRAKDRALVNIAVLKGNATQGSKALVKGHFRNLLQQSRELEFSEIQEQNATYYLASFHFTSEDILNFEIDVQPEASETSHTVSFSRKMQREP